MFLVTVHLPNSFPFTDVEVFMDGDDAVAKAREWLAVGATKCEVADVDSYLAIEANRTFTLVGLGRALGYELDLTDTGADRTETRELVAA